MRDQVVVVRDDLLLAAGIVQNHQFHRAAEEPASVIGQLCPDVVAALSLLAWLREVSGQRQRDADANRVIAAHIPHATRLFGCGFLRSRIVSSFFLGLAALSRVLGV